MQRKYTLDVLKGSCICLVIVAHFITSEEIHDLFFPVWSSMVIPIFMIISGYVYAGSYTRHNIQDLGEAYQLEFLADKILRYTIPFWIAYSIELLGLYFIQGKTMKWESWLTGGYGMGSYYYPVMMQFIFVFPVIYFLIKKYDVQGLLLCGGMNLVYEILQHAYEMNAECYRLLMFRYILTIAFGAYLYLKTKKIKRIVGSFSFIIGFSFIVAVNYMGYIPRIITQWPSTSFISCLYIFPIAALLIEKCSIRVRLLEVAGKASYNIFLTQMVYYALGAEKIYSMIDNRGIELAVNILVCVSVGIAFYYVEVPITKAVINKVHFCVEKYRQKNRFPIFHLFYDDSCNR